MKVQAPICRGEDGLDPVANTEVIPTFNSISLHISILTQEHPKLGVTADSSNVDAEFRDTSTSWITKIDTSGEILLNTLKTLKLRCCGKLNC